MQKASSYEEKIIKILTCAGVPFEREKSFKDLRGGKYRYDFYLPAQDIVLEINGPQHYVFTPPFHKSRTDLMKQQEHDRRKISYALANNITIYQIPYWDIDKINDITLLCTKEYKATTKFHNDIAFRQHKNCK